MGLDAVAGLPPRRAESLWREGRWARRPLRGQPAHALLSRPLPCVEEPAESVRGWFLLGSDSGAQKTALRGTSFPGASLSWSCGV